MFYPPNILTIAGSDSGGGAGIQADIKTIMALGGYAMSVITALTAQNGLGVQGIFAPPASFTAQQMESVLSAFPVAAAKTGMLFSTEIIQAVATSILSAPKPFPLVVDPVCASQSGHQLLEDDAVDALRIHILPLASLLTPNVPEAELLAGMPVQTEEDIFAAGAKLLGMGPKAVLIKGGHRVSSNPITVTDWFFEPGAEPVPLRQGYVATENNHGTGCTLSAAIATYIGLEQPVRVAITKAQEYLNLCLRHAFAPGKGIGAPWHSAKR